MDSKLEENAGELGNCEICFQKADGVHFSVVSCRACAAFFRRTVILKLTYNCRNKDACGVEKAHRNMCRSCRYSRCLNKGMRSEAVQYKRDTIGKKKPKSVPESDCEPLTISTTLNEIFKSEECINKNQKSTTILSQMTDGYEHFMKIRKATTSLLQKNVLATLFKDPKMEMSVSRYDSAKKVCQVEAHLITDIVNTYFVPFNTLKYDDKVAFFKNFFCYFSHTDRAYQSYMQFENDQNNDKILMPDGGFIKRSELGRFYENAQGVHTSPEDAAKIFQPALDYILDVIIEYMRRIKIEKTEYLALLGFCLWDDDVPGLSKEAKQLSIETQSHLLNELQIFYEKQMYDQSMITSRIGKLLLLIPKLTKCVIMLRENSLLAELFNYYEADVCCKNFKDQSLLNVECTSSCIVHTANHK